MSTLPNQQTVITSITIIANLACYLLKQPLLTTATINLSLRCVSIYQTSRSNRYYKIPIDITAFIALVTLKGVLLSVGLDVLSEALNFYHHHRRKPPSESPLVPTINRLDPSSFENSCKILGLGSEEAKDRAKVETQYQTILHSLQEKHKNVSAPFRPSLQQMIEDVQAAYKTVLSA